MRATASPGAATSTPSAARALAASGAAAAAPASLGPPAPSAVSLANPGRGALRLGDRYLSRAAWSVGRTGRTGLVGIALLLAAGLFLLSTHRQIAADVAGLRADVVAAQSSASTAQHEPVDPAASLRALPTRAEVPAVLRQMFQEATNAGLAVDTAKYDVAATKSSGVVRYQIAFPVTGPYPAIRTFVDSILATMPAVGLRELTLERKSIGDADVDAQMQFTIYARSAP